MISYKNGILMAIYNFFDMAASVAILKFGFKPLKQNVVHYFSFIGSELSQEKMFTTTDAQKKTHCRHGITLR